MCSTVDKSIFKDDVCRLCASISIETICIFDENAHKVDVQITQCFPSLEVKEDDLKPKRICLECSIKLNSFSEFLLLCLATDLKFDKCIKYDQNQHSGLEDIREQDLGTNYDLFSCQTENYKPKSSGNSTSAGENVIVLSEMNENMNSSLGDYVVMVEVKYKNGVDLNDGKDMGEFPPAMTENSKPVEICYKDIHHDEIVPHSSAKSNSLDAMAIKTVVAGDAVAEKQESIQVLTSSSGSPSMQKKPFSCPICSKSYPRRTRLNSHMALHSDSRPHVCATCGKGFPMKWALNSHQKIHLGTFACSVCHKAFSTSPKLERHKRVHTGEKPFVCSECGKGFSDKRNLDNHMRIHTGEKPFVCPICLRAFSVKSHVKEHLLLHSRRENFECPHCFKKFRWRNNWNRHIKMHKEII